MPRDFFPRSDSGVRSFTENFARVVALDPPRYGLTAAQSDSLTLSAHAFADAYQLSQGHTTRTPAILEKKDLLRDQLEAEVRMLGRMIRGNPAVNSEMRIELGLSAPAQRGSRIEPPAKAPKLAVVRVDGRTVRLRLMDADSPASRGRPKSASAAAIFVAIAEDAPTTQAQWTFALSTSRVVAGVEFPAGTAPGTKVWLTAYWLSPRQERSAVATAVSTRIHEDLPQLPSLAA